MHTSAQRQHASLEFELSGILAANAEVRMTPDTTGHFVPTLRIELSDVKGMPVKHIVIYHACLDHADATRRAKDLLRGRYITFESKLEDMKISFPRTTAINIL